MTTTPRCCAGHRLRAAGLAVAVGAIALIGAGCGSSSTTASAPTTVAPTSATTPADAATGAPHAQGTATTSTAASTTTTAAGGGGGGAGSFGNDPDSSGCANLTGSDAVRAALVQAAGAAGGETQPGHTYYGSCGGTSYAVTAFQAGPDATLQEQVSFQDDGAAPRFFVLASGGAWRQVGQLGFPAPPSSATFDQAPLALRQLWQDCPAG